MAATHERPQRPQCVGHGHRDAHRASSPQSRTLELDSGKFLSRDIELVHHLTATSNYE
jgi:hypothetical protein